MYVILMPYFIAHGKEKEQAFRVFTRSSATRTLSRTLLEAIQTKPLKFDEGRLPYGSIARNYMPYPNATTACESNGIFRATLFSV